MEILELTRVEDFKVFNYNKVEWKWTFDDPCYIENNMYIIVSVIYD